MSNRLLTAFKAIRQLGIEPVALNALYRVGLKVGHYKRVEKSKKQKITNKISPVFTFPKKEEIFAVIGEDGEKEIFTEAEEIVQGKVRLFGSDAVELKLTLNDKLEHWTAYETGKVSLSSFNLPHGDIKFLWEPARFGWVFVLGRAYHLSGDERYAEAFWHYTEQFIDANPPNMGPHWMSGQEVALRLMAQVWGSQVFSPSPHSTPVRMEKLGASLAAHAERIPSTLIYARSQNNNHLLTEAAGLYTAGLALGVDEWTKLGWKWLVWCFERQIDVYGEYVQYSANYHRLMLQTALWVRALGGRFPALANENLSLATHWLYSLLDPQSGRVPNLGANDGALIFLLAPGGFGDFRPVVQAAARAFMEYNLPGGAWDEMALWFGLPHKTNLFETPRYFGDHLYAKNSWGYLRAVRFKSRPSHADQLHVDLWWRGLNIARDAGTYLYNADPPWDNSLTSTLVHNTVTVNGEEQMKRASRFLYLDWANAESPRNENALPNRRLVRTNAYRQLGVRHTRALSVGDDERWTVEDELLALTRFERVYRLHWLLPDWEWKAEGDAGKFVLRLLSPHGAALVQIRAQNAVSVDEVTNAVFRVSIVRAGELVYGKSEVSPIRGWYSPTYAHKEPAISLAVEVTASENVRFITEFFLPKGD